jgi:catecholate siderophore receptor
MSKKSTVRQALGITGLGLGTVAVATGALGETANDDAGAIETVLVTGQRSSLDLLTEKILDTPQSINVVPAEVIRQQGVSSLQEALKNVPGITLNAGEGGAHGDTVNLRGFSASDDFYLDGLRDTGFYTRDAFDYDAVEVYKGPASTLFGRGSTGGVINQVTKKPELDPIDTVSLTGGSNSEIRAVGDFDFAVDDDSAIRTALMGQRSDVEGRPYVRNQRYGIAPSFATGIGTDTTFTLSLVHEQEDSIPDFGIPFIDGAPAPVPRDTYYGLPSNDRFKTDVNIATARFEHRFADNITVSDTARVGFYWYDSIVTAPHFGSANCYTGSAPFAGGPVCTGAAGETPVTAANPLLPVPGMPLADVFVQRDRPTSKGTVQTLMNQTDLSAKFDTGVFSHDLVVGVDIDREAADLTRFANQDTAIVTVPLLAPNPNEAFPGPQTTVTSRPVTKTSTIGLYAIDTIGMGPHWSLVGALRYDHFTANYDEPIGNSQFAHADDIVSPRAALIYKFDETSSLYFSYGTSFDPSAENLSLSSRTADLAPEKDRTYEVGGKAIWLDGKLATTAALFNTEMTNARIADPLIPSLQELAGDERVNGFEFDVEGYIAPHWEITAGYTYLDPYSNGLVAANVAGVIPNTAHNQANLWTVYEFPQGFALGTGLNYVGKRPGDPGNSEFAPSYITWDAMASYKFTDTFGLQLNVQNITDEYYFANVYYSSAAENHAIPGAGRTFLLTANLSL